jgi:hypothetical protein
MAATGAIERRFDSWDVFVALVNLFIVVLYGLNIYENYINMPIEKQILRIFYPFFVLTPFFILMCRIRVLTSDIEVDREYN